MGRYKKIQEDTRRYKKIQKKHKKTQENTRTYNTNTNTNTTPPPPPPTTTTTTTTKNQTCKLTKKALKLRGTSPLTRTLAFIEFSYRPILPAETKRPLRPRSLPSPCRNCPLSIASSKRPIPDQRRHGHVKPLVILCHMRKACKGDRNTFKHCSQHISGQHVYIAHITLGLYIIMNEFPSNDPSLGLWVPNQKQGQARFHEFNQRKFASNPPWSRTIAMLNKNCGHFCDIRKNCQPRKGREFDSSSCFPHREKEKQIYLCM